MGGALAVGTGQRHDALVDLDARDDVVIAQYLDEGRTVVRLLVEGLVEENDAADVLARLLADAEQKLSILPAVLFYVLNVDGSQPLAHGACNGVSLV